MRTPLVIQSPIVFDRRGRQIGRRRFLWSLFPTSFRSEAKDAMRHALAGRPFRVGLARQKARHWQIAWWHFRPIFAGGQVTAVEVTTARASWPARS